MANTYNWTISALDCIPDLDGKLDYVVTAHWQCIGTDGTFTGQVYSTQSFTVNPDKPDYTPYADLTEAEVVGWVQAALGEEGTAAVYTSIDTQIQNQIDPPIITPPLPWSQPSA